VVTSPNFPLFYPNLVSCHMLIQAPAGKTISLHPYKIDTDINFSTRRCYDKIDIYDGDTALTTNRLGNKSFCGSVLPPSFTSSGSNMLITFNADASRVYTGFAFTYIVSSPSGMFIFVFLSLEFFLCPLTTFI